MPRPRSTNCAPAPGTSSPRWALLGGSVGRWAEAPASPGARGASTEPQSPPAGALQDEQSAPCLWSSPLTKALWGFFPALGAWLPCPSCCCRLEASDCNSHCQLCNASINVHVQDWLCCVSQGNQGLGLCPWGLGEHFLQGHTGRREAQSSLSQLYGPGLGQVLGKEPFPDTSPANHISNCRDQS